MKKSRPRAGSHALRALEQCSSGTVVSTFDRALNILLESGHLITLLAREMPLHPWAITSVGELYGTATGICTGSAEAAARNRPRRLRIRRHFAGTVEKICSRIGGSSEPGPEVTFSGSVLLVSNLLAVPLEDAECVRCDITHRPSSLDSGLISILSEVSTPPPSSLFEPKISLHLERLRNGDVSAVPSLVGLGDGLTPSGDDILVGFMAALDFASDAHPSAEYRKAVTTALPQPLGSFTTRLSSQMLTTAIEGCYAEPILEVLSIIYGKSYDLLPEAARRLERMGHRSGMDTMQGIIAGLDLVQNRT